MRKIYITFSGRAYDETTAHIVQRAPQMGADEVWVYDDLWLMGQEFYKLNHWLWDHHGDRDNHKRGFGWFAWKPFIILDALSRLADGDIVLFTDADTYPIENFSVLYEECVRNNGFMLFAAQGLPNEHWVKRDCFVIMGQDVPRYRFCQAGVARFMLFQKGSWSVQQFLMEWLTYCVNPLATTFDPSAILPEYPELKEHRTEQAIMTLLAHKYGQKLYREACEFGEGHTEDTDLYPTLFKQVYASGTRDLTGSKYRRGPHLQ